VALVIPESREAISPKRGRSGSRRVPIRVPMRVVVTLLVIGVVAAAAAPAQAAGDPDVAALQVGLRARGLYVGTVDGVLGGSTTDAVRRLQQKKGLVADGVPGPRTRAALGRYGRSAPLGRRTLVLGHRGWDVAALQFALAWHGFPSGPLDGHLGARSQRALVKFQVWAGVPADGTAGGSTFAALRRPVPRSPLRLALPLQGPFGDLYGPRGLRFHSGVDFPSAFGTPVAAAGAGRVVFAGVQPGGWGRFVVVQHARGVRTLYAHLSRIGVGAGQRVAAGAPIGRVGASGGATGPHLHFEVFVRGANVDPQTAF
jgi:murein DD-endopeptidase MepM/ murein hydrolase activator NlpD